ncbi:MAG: carbon-nitrogen hydrolase family protein [Rhodobacter sp.]|nr:carbon-nitrogen hydrolase family protein [Rhodobacter sp.]
MRVTLIQNNPQDNVEASLAVVGDLIARAAEQGTDLIALPEYYAFMGNTVVEHRDAGQQFEAISGRMAELARTNGVAIHAGSLAELRGNRTFNTTVVYGADGAELARYSKIHMFDIELPNGDVIRESDIISRGDEVVTYSLNGWTVGCTICYDLRFPELFRALRDRGADLIFVPSAFMLDTGRDHWEVLLRARAVETGCYVAAPGQVFKHAKGARACFGHSLVADPWGHVVAQVSDVVGLTTATLDRDYLATVRARMPVHNHHVLN